MAALQNAVIAGLPNPLAAAVVTITAGAEGSSMLASKLKRYSNGPARLTSISPHLSHWTVDFGPTPLAQVRALALGRHTLIPGDQVRAVAVDSGALPAVRSQTLPPTAIEASANMQATSVLVLDEHPSTTDNSLALPTVETDPWSIRLSFGTPSSAPAVGAAVGGDYQCFLARARQVNTSQSGADFPTVKASLYEGGVLRKVLGTKAFTLTDPGTTGRFLIFPWNASDLQTADGSAVELLLEFEPGSGIAYGGLDSVSWEVLSATDKAAADLDTGWDTIAGAEIQSDWGNTSIQEVDLPRPLWHKFLSTPQTIAKLRLEFRADGVGYFTDFVHTPPRTPADSIDAHWLIPAQAFEFPFNFAPGGRLIWRAKHVGDVAIDGAQNLVVQYRWRECELDVTLTASQAAALFERVDQSGGEIPFLLALQPSATGTQARNATFLATAIESGGHVYDRPMRGGETTRLASYRFTEKL